MASLGNLIPLGKKSEKPKNDDLTSGLISIGNKTTTKDDLDDFDLDDLLSDTPKPSKKSSSPKKPKKSKEKKKKKKASSFEFDDEDEDSPGRKAQSFQFEDEVPKPKTSMKNLDEEFAKALGFDESEFLSANMDEPPTSPEVQRESSIRETKKSPIIEKSKPFEANDDKGISASFFNDPEPTNVAIDTSSFNREVGERPKGRGRRNVANDSIDPFAKEAIKLTDPFSKADDSSGKAGRIHEDEPRVKTEGIDPPSNKPSSRNMDDPFSSSSRRRSVDPFATKNVAEEEKLKEIKPIAVEEDTPSFPWMKAKQEKKIDPFATKNVAEEEKLKEIKQIAVDEDTPSFPWMKAKQVTEKTPTEKAEEDIPKFPSQSNMKETKNEDENSMPSFPWMKKKAEEKPKEEPKEDLPTFPWTKIQTPKDHRDPPPVETAVDVPSPPKVVASPPKPPSTPPKLIPSPPKLLPEESTLPPMKKEELVTFSTSDNKPESPSRPATSFELGFDKPPSVHSSRHSSPVKEPSPRRSSASPSKIGTISYELESTEKQTPTPPNEPLFASRISPEKKGASPPRSPIIPEVTTQTIQKLPSPKRTSPSSRAAFLNDAETIVPAFVTHQLEQCQEQVTLLSNQLTAATASLAALQAEHELTSTQLRIALEEKGNFATECAQLRAQDIASKEEVIQAQLSSKLCQEQVTNFITEKQAMQSEVNSLRLQNGEVLSLQTLTRELQLENGSLRAQLSTAQANLANAQRDLIKEQTMHTQNVERLQRMEHQREQEALHQQRWQAEEQRHTEKEALERLLMQVRAAVSGLKVLQESVVGGKSEMEMRAMGDTETRSRVLLEMEGSCKALLNRSQEECHRLQALLGAMEGTMRSLRGEHMEEKERLRLEQARLDELAMHFQAQTTLLQERTDSNTRVVTQTLSAYIQDIRVAEARLHTRREQLQEEERQLHFARASFAAQQEEALREQRLAQDKLFTEQKRVEEKLHRVRQETQAFEQLVFNHSSEMEALAAMQMQLEGEKERLQAAAARVEVMAENVRAASEKSTTMEIQAKEAMKEATMMVNQMQDERLRVQKQSNQLEERERRLHDELRFMDNSRRKRAIEERVNRVSSLSKRTPVSLQIPSAATFKVNNNQTDHYQSHSVRPQRDWRDPSGLSPSFRHEMEQFWKHGNQVSENQLRDRMLLSCIGLPSATRPVSRPLSHFNPQSDVKKGGTFKI